MRDNKIDKLFKEKTTQGSFSYKDSYWRDAEKLIVANQAAANGRFWSAGKAVSIITFITMMSVGSTLWFDQPTENTNANTIEESLVNTPEDDNLKADNKRNATIVNSVSSESENNEIKNTGEAITKESIADGQNNDLENSEKDGYKEIAKQNNLSRQNEVKLEHEFAPVKTTEVTASISKAQAEAEQKEISKPKPAPAAEADLNTSQSEPEAFVSSPVQTKNSSKKSTVKTEANDSDVMVSVDDNTTPANEDSETTDIAAQTMAESQTTIAEPEPSISSSTENKEDIILPHQASKNWLFSVGLDYSYLFTSRTFTGQPSDYVSFRNAYESESHSTSLGFQVVAEHGNWIFNSGISQTSFTDNIAYPQTLDVLVGVDNGTWLPEEIWTYTVDSSWQITGIYQGGWNYDTTWALNYDSTYIPQWDSVLTEKEDPTLAANNGKSTFSYIEIPLWLGRTFGEGRWQIFVQGGASIGILSGTKGSIYINRNVDGLLRPEYQIEQFNQFTYQAMLRAGVRFDVSSQIQATLAPMMRYTLNSVLKGEGLDQRYLGYGLNVGLSYRF